MSEKFDFSGWATKVNLMCSDGRVIRKGAFKHCDGMVVPLVWNHQHNKPEEVLGHALLENRDDGVYAYCTFNDTESGQNAKLLVQHGDVNQLSIYANKLRQQGSNVLHGVIREVSLVLAGANPGAYIDSVMMHGEESDEEAVIYTGEFIENVEPLFHSDENEKKGEEKKVDDGTKKKEINSVDFDKLTDEQKKKVREFMANMTKQSDGETNADSGKEEKKDAKELEHAADKSDDKTATGKSDEETVQDVLDTLTEKQKNVVQYLIGRILEDKDEPDDDDEGGKEEMKHNVFDQDTNEKNVLSHSDMMEIMADAKRTGSLRDAVLAHGITDIEYLFPDAQTIDKTPGFIKRDDTWVADVMNSVHHTPFSRIKSIFADITEADARAKGYIKGKLKVEEVFTLLKRVTTPATIYKKQKIDRDDLIDITDFDVVAWLKSEMRMMLDEEIARAVLVGDGRNPSSNDKINEQNIRPIWTDDDVYTVKAAINVASDATDDVKAKAFIKATIKSRKNYKGSGNPVMFISEDMLTNCLLLEDLNGRVIYDTIDKLATALRVKKIIPVPVMENLTRVKGANTHELAGIYVNLADYNIGADKGGAVNMFDDFDIDYNQQKYLIETRISGALTVPYSAVAIEFVTATTPSQDEGTV